MVSVGCRFDPHLQFMGCFCEYRKTDKLSHTLAGKEIAGHSDVVRASPVGAVPTS